MDSADILLYYFQKYFNLKPIKLTRRKMLTNMVCSCLDASVSMYPMHPHKGHSIQCLWDGQMVTKKISDEYCNWS